MAGMSEGHADLRALQLERGADERITRPLAERLAHIGRRLTPVGRIDALAHRLVQAGNPRDMDVTQVLTAKVALGLIGLAVGLLRVVVKPSGGAILLGAADTIDQLTVSVEAGLGLEAAMAQVVKSSEGPFADELARTLQDIRAGVPRHRALKDLAARLDVPEVRQIVFAIIQSEKHGLPIAETLRVQADDLRVRRRQRAEEKALKLPVKIVFPTLLCIMPSLFIVILGPAAIRIYRTLVGG
jgi:tight adherence protein C